MSEAKRKGKDLLQHMEAKDLLEYGSVITGDEVRSVLGIELPEVASKGVFSRAALQELGAVDYVRNTLLGHGKYLGQDGDTYRIYLPSENAKVLARYAESADRKLRRAIKLWRSSPDLDTEDHRDETGARLFMKREAIKSRTVFGKPPED